MKPSYKCITLVVLSFLFLNTLTWAHEIRPAYLEITETHANEYQVLWKVPRMNELVPNIQPVFPATFDVKAIGLPQESGDAFIFRFHVMGKSKGLGGEVIAIDGLNKTLVDALVRINYLNGESATCLLQPSKPSAILPAKADTWSVIKSYTHLGVEHIWTGIDHLLFVLALILITHGAWTILKTITAFTLAHSITLSLAALGKVHVAGPPVEAVIALSIVFLAVEIINELKGRPTITGRKPWLVAFTFGLLHGLGFASALAEVGLPQNDIPWALGFFNVGVELGQLAFIMVVLLVIRLFAIKKNWSPVLKKVPAYAIGSMAAFWLIERVVAFW